MLTDAGSIALALTAARLAARPTSSGFTFGFKRAEVLSAQLNGASLLVLGALLAWAERRSLNVEGARQHVLADLYGSLAAVLGGLVVLLAGWREADAVAALVVVALMLRSGWGLLRASSRVLLEAAPEGLDTDAIGHALSRHPGILEVHDLHVWELTTDFPALSAHVLVAPGDDCHGRRVELERLLRDEFGIDHTTLRVDHEHRPELLELR